MVTAGALEPFSGLWVESRRRARFVWPFGGDECEKSQLGAHLEREQWSAAHAAEKK